MTTPAKRVQQQRSARQFAADLSDMDRRLRAVERQAQLARSSIENGAITVVSEGQPTVVIGDQPDGTGGVVVIVGPVPPRPAPPDVRAVPGGLVVRWSGVFVNDDGTLNPLLVAPLDFERMDVVIGVAPEQPVILDFIATPPVGAIMSPRGSEVFIALTDLVPHQCALVTRTKSGRASIPSAHVTATPEPPIPPFALAVNRVFRQASPPVSTAEYTLRLNDTWYDTDDGNKPYVWDGDSWESAQDATIAIAQAAAEAAYDAAVEANADAAEAMDFAQASNRVFRQATAPVSTAEYTLRLNDTWYDTANGNAVKVWNGSAWVTVQDASIATAQAAAVAAHNAASAAAADAAEAMDFAEASNRVFRQANPPVSDGSYTLRVGDTWFETDAGNAPRVWDGDSWESVQDGSIAIAQTAAAAAQTQANTATTSAANAMNYAQVSTRTYRQASQPTTDPNRPFVVGDQWYETDNGNMLRVWDGSAWVTTQDATIATAQAAANAAAAQAAAAAGQADNRVKNGSFENGLTDWTSGANHTIDTTTYWDGIQSLKITGAGSLTQPAVPVIEGRTYRFSLRYKTSAGFTTSTGNRPLHYPDGNNVPGYTNFVPSVDWATNEFTYTIPAGVTSVHPVRVTGTPAGGDVWIDAVRFEDVTDIINTNRVFRQTTAPVSSVSYTLRVGDTWFDTDDGNRPYVWSGSAWVSVQDGSIATAQAAAAAAQTQANTATTNAANAMNYAQVSTRTYRQPSQPTVDPNRPFVVGDQWYETDNGNMLRVWDGSAWVTTQDATIATAQAAANAAQTQAQTATTNAANAMNYAQVSTRTYRQDAQPTVDPNRPFVVGDQWYETDNGNMLRVWNGSAWVTTQDATIVTAQTAANAAMTQAQTATTNAAAAMGLAQSSNRVFRQANAPVSDGSYTLRVGDTWFETDAGNIARVWDGDSWETVQDGSIATAQAAAVAAQGTANTAVTNAANAMNYAQVSTRTYRQDTQPTTDPNRPFVVGDQWYETDNGNMLRVWSGSAWVTTQDATIATAQAAANAAQTQANTATTNAANAMNYAQVSTRTYRQNAQPTTDPNRPFVVGDQWYETDNGNMLRVWDGSAWVTTQDATIATAQAAANAAQTQANTATTNAATAMNYAQVSTRTYRQDAQPTVDPNRPFVVGDQWYETDNGNMLRVWNGSAWITTQDATIATAQAAANAAAAQAAAAAGQADNRVKNGSFENGLTDWTYSASNHIIDTTTYWDGIQSLKITGVSAVVTQPAVPVIEGRTYRFSVRYKTAAGYTSGGTGNRPVKYPAGDNVPGYVNFVNNVNWTTSEFTYTIPAGVTSVTPARVTGAPAGGDVWIDAVRFEDVTDIINTNRVFRQTAAPASTISYTLRTGDTWFDTDDGNRPYVWDGSAWVTVQDGSIATAQAAAVAAQTQANTATTNAANAMNYAQVSTRTYRQDTQPTTDPNRPFVVGDQWYETDNGNMLRVWNGSAWVTTQDATIATAQAAANAAQTQANTATTNAAAAMNFAQVSTRTYRQNAQPTTDPNRPFVVGDQWYETDNGNMLRIWDGSAWVTTQDATIATAQAAAVAAQTQANTATTNAANAMNYAQTSTNRTFRQSTAPVSDGSYTLRTGDTWFNTGAGNAVKVWDGAAWANAQDAAIGTAQTTAAAAQASANTAQTQADTALASAGTAQATADGKMRTFFQTAAPTGLVAGDVGDLWFDTDDGNKMYRWSGTAWVVSQDQSLSDSIKAYVQSRATNLITNGSGILGDDTNFSPMTFDPLDTPTGARGSFDTQIGVANTSTTDEMIAVDPTKRFRLTFMAKQKGATAAGYMYAGASPFDAYGLAISSQYYMFTAGTLTTLAAPLNPGDTTVTLTSSANWYGVAGKNAGTSTHLRSLIFWDYVDAGGKAWPAETYSRNTSGSDVYADGGITGNVITLRVPWAGTAKAAGTQVSNNATGSTYVYGGISNSIVPKAWTAYGASITGTVTGGLSASFAAGWPSGTAQAKIVFLTNRLTTTGSSDPDSRHSVALVSFSDAAAAQEVADRKITTFYQAAPPVSTGLGDLWVDTDDNNHLYRALSVGADAVTAGEWVSVRDATIATASASASAAMTQANAALTAAQSAQATADGAIRTYYQSGAPTGLNNTTDVGDMWFDTDDGQAYRWSGTAWTIIEDNSIAVALAAAQSAQTTADGKITAYYQTAAPTGLPASDAGDLWYDTDDGNKPYYWSGTAWVTIRDATIATAHALAQTAVNDAATANTAAGAAQSAANTAQAAANTAQAAANTANANALAANKTFRQTTAPVSDGSYTLRTGDTWFDTDDGNRPWVWSGTAWTDVQDSDIAASQAAADAAMAQAQQATTDAATAQQYATAANSVYRQADPPTRLSTVANYVTNPSVETVTTNWSSVVGTGGAGTVTRTTDGTARVGAYYYRRTWTTASTGGSAGINAYSGPLATGSITPGLAYGVGIWVRSSVGGDFRVSWTWRDAANASLGTITGAYITVPADTWTWVSHGSATVAPAGTDRMLSTFYTLTPQPVGATIDSDGYLIRDGGTAPVETEYADGETATDVNYGYAWSGTANASRTLRYPVQQIGDTWYDTDDNNRIRVWDGNSWEDVALGATALDVELGGGNLLYNTNAGNGTVGWTNYVVAQTVVSDTIGYVDGRSWKITSTAAGTVTGLYRSILSFLQPNRTYTASAWVRIPTVSGVSRVDLYVNGAGTVAEVRRTHTTVDGVWTRLVATFTTTAVPADGVNIYLYSATGQASGLYFNVGAVQLEAGEIPSSYAPRPDETLPGTITATEISDDAITTPKLSANAITAKHTLTGPTIQTEATAARGVKINSTGLIGYDGAGVSKFLLTTAGVLTLAGAIASGSTIDGTVLTGGTVQTEATASRGIKMSSTGLTLYDGVGVATMVLTAATGAMTMTGPVLTGGSVTGATLQTETTAARGIKMTSTALTGYDAAGVTKFSLSSGGVLTLAGSITTGGSIDGAVVTGGTVQTEATALRGIKMNSTGLTAYDGAGVATLTITAATGAISMLGSLTSGSTVTGATITGGTVQSEATANRGVKITSGGLTAYDSGGVATLTITASTGAIAMTGGLLTGGTVTGSTLQTETTAARGVKMTTGGLFGYDGAGVSKFSLTTAGVLTTAGNVSTGGTIDGAVVTGGTLQSEATASRGIKINSTGMTGYDGAGVAKFTLTSAGALTLVGALQTGGTITGPTLQTETTAARGIKLDTTGLYGYDAAGVNKFSLTTTGVLTTASGVSTGGSITGAVITGGTLQSEITDAGGVKINPSGLIAYNGSAVVTTSIAAATGILTTTGGLLTGGTITGPVLQTETTAARGIKMDTTGLYGYNGTGVNKFSLTTLGVLTVADSISTGGSLTGAVVTGGTVQTETTANRGIKMNSTGLTAYDGAGVATLTITAATGAIAMLGSLTSGSTVAGATVTGGTVTGAVVQTEVTAARGVKITTGGLFGYDGAGVSKFSLTTAGVLTTAGNVSTGGTIDGAVVTGGTVQTEVTALRGIKINSSGMTGYDGAGVAKFTLTTAGALTLVGALQTGGTITGPVVQTETTAARGIKLDTTGLYGYDAAGVSKFSLTTAGVLTTAGNITTGGSIDGATITGGTVQTEVTAARGIKINSTGMTGYDGAGVAKFTLTSAGALTLVGALQTGGTITGPTLQTETTAARGIKLDTTGLYGYDAAGVSKFSLTTAGVLTTAGNISTGGTIDGAVVTGGTVQTEATALRGIKINSSGMTGYDGTGAAKFTLTTAGALTLVGALQTGGTITGPVVQTETTAARGIKLDTTGLYGYNNTGVNKFSLTTLGVLTTAGNISTGGTIDGAVVTGGTLQSEATANRGIKINSTGLTAYDGAGAATLTIVASTGAVSMLGALTSGSTVAGAAVTGGSVTGAVVQTEVTAARGVKMTTGGLFGYDAAGVSKFSLTTAGVLTTAGNVSTGGSIDGAVVTGGTLQSEATAARGIKINSTGMTGYDGAGVAKFTLTSAGALTLVGALQTGGTITGPTLQTETTASRGIKMDTTGLYGYDGAGVSKFSLTTLGVLTTAGNISTGGSIDGAVVTGGTLQSEATASRGIKINSTGMTGYDGAGVAKFTLTSAGALTLVGALQTGGTITGPVVQTEATAARGIKMDTTGLYGYDGAGVSKFSLTTLGVLTTAGEVSTGGSVTGAVVTGGTVQTETTASRGIKMNSTGLTAYDAVGTAMFTITAATGAIAMRGSLTSGSSIDGATVTGGSVTGAVVQTETTAARGVKITTGGLFGYDGAGVSKFSLTTLGVLTIAGAIASGGSIDGAVVTGGTLQTEVTASRGIKINSSGMTGYDSGGVAKFSLTTLGALTIVGAVQTGGTITGPVLQTETAASRGIKMDLTGIYGYNEAGVTKFSLTKAGVLTVADSISSGGSIDGAVITGGTLQTETTVARGIKMNSTGFTAYTDGSIVGGPVAGTAMFTITAATGAIAMRGSLTSGSSIDGATVTGGSVTGAVVQTEVTAARGVKITTGGLYGYDAAGVAKFTLTTAGVLTLAGAIASGSTIDGAVLTGGTVQTEATASRGIKINSSGMTGYDGAGVAKFTLTTAGALTIVGPVQTGGTITGPVVQTETTAARGIKLDTTGLYGYNATGVNKFSLTTLGALTVADTITTGGTIDGAIVTGGTLQTEVTAARGVKINSSGLTAYNASGVATTTIVASTGVLTTTGGVLTGGTITGPTFQTEATAARGVKIDTTGVYGYYSSGGAYTLGTTMFSVSAVTGMLNATGGITSGGDIDGAVITGGTIQTEVTANRGIKMNSTQLIGYGNDGIEKFKLLASAGATITGGMIQTTSTAARGVKMDSTGIYGYDSVGNQMFALSASTGLITSLNVTAGTITGATIRTASSGRRMEFSDAIYGYSGIGSDGPAKIDIDTDYAMYIKSATKAAGSLPAGIFLHPPTGATGSSNTKMINLLAAKIGLYYSADNSSSGLSALLMDSAGVTCTGPFKITASGGANIQGGIVVTGGGLTVQAGGADITGAMTTDAITATGDITASGTDNNVEGYQIFARSPATATSTVANVRWDSTGGQYKIVSSSAAKYKENIRDAELDLAPLLQVRVRAYDYRKDYNPDAGPQIGLIADELAALGLTPWVVYDEATGEIEDVAYGRLTVPLIALCKAQQEQIDTQQSQIDSLLAWKEEMTAA